MTETTLILFCKRPALGFGKQRLAAEIGAQAAFEVAEGLLACALEDLENWSGPVVISPSCRQEMAWAEGLLVRNCEVIPQSEGNLGERIESIDFELRTRSCEKQIVIGSDAPELSQALLNQADGLLNDADVVFSAADDGGVSLMATRRGWPPLGGMPWSTECLGVALVDGCEQVQQTVSWADPCSDVDRVTDLKRIGISLQRDKRRSRQALLQIVERVLGS